MSPTEKFSKIPSWVWSAVWQAVLLIFALGVASERYAPKEYVDDKIKEHAVATEGRHVDDMREIKEALKRIEERQYEQAKRR